MKKLFLLPLFMVLMTFQSKAQQIDYAKAALNNPSFDVQLNYVFEDQSKLEELEIEVDENVLVLSIDINIGLKSGKINVEILDVNGEVVREIKLNAGVNYKDFFAEGNLSERIKQPEPGIWKIQFNPENATLKTTVRYKTLFVD